jgi:FKBP-type peptidyl-prolyl cis-trans isomerase
VVVACVSLLAALPLDAKAAPRGDFSMADDTTIREKWPEAIETPSGMRYVVLQPGEGPTPRPRQKLRVLYRGSLLNGTEFSNVQDRENPFSFSLGSGEVIVGWEEAFADMRKGEKRVLIIPYALGYGLRGRPPDIPNRATLVFEVELLSID